jgi:hypothetical protein
VSRRALAPRIDDDTAIACAIPPLRDHLPPKLLGVVTVVAILAVRISLLAHVQDSEKTSGNDSQRRRDFAHR